ncbi:MAG: radical SAM protein [Bacteroidales bacterium]|nr:radical SAM protein [Bacteroidales bacterium]
MRTIEVEFDVTKKINIPSCLFEKKIKDSYIILAPEYPNWIILNKEEYQIFQYLKKNIILNSLLKFKKVSGKKDEEILTIVQSLLIKIEENKFYAHTNIDQEKKVRDIIKKIHINVTNSCNLRCKHCYLSAGINEVLEINFIKLKLFLDNLYKINGKTEIVVSGGEPLCYNSIYALLKYLKNAGHRVILFTNGILIDNNNIRYIEKYCDEIQLSMEGISENYYENIRGKGNYAKLLNTFRLIKDIKIQLTLAITILEDVFDDIEKELLIFLKNIGMKNITIRLNDEIEKKGNAIHLASSNFLFDHNKKLRLNNIINNLNHEGYGVGISKARNIHFSNCGIGTNIVINFDEKVYPCSMFDIDFYNLDTDIGLIIKEFNLLNECTGIDKMGQHCAVCELKHLCSGGCRIRNYTENGSYIIPYCTPEIKEKKFYNLFLEKKSYDH